MKRIDFKQLFSLINRSFLKDTLDKVFALLGFISVISGISGYVPFYFLCKEPNSFYQYILNIGNVMLFILFLYFIVALYNIYKIARKIDIEINGIKVIIKYGDIFKQDGLKLISFNDQFDCKVDGSRVSPHTLHGKFLSSLDSLNTRQIINKIKSNPHNIRIYHGVGENVATYELGTILCYEDFLLLALTHLNEHNISYIDMNEYEPCLRKMWSEINRIYGGIPKISLPLVGGGVSRMRGGQLSLNQKLDCLLCSLKRSDLQFDKNTKISIILDPGKRGEINLFDIKQRYKI